MTLSDRFHWHHHTEVCSEQNFLSLRAMTIYALWRQRWYHRIGTRAYKRVWWMGECSTCGKRTRTFSVGGWHCDDHLPSKVGEPK